MLFNPFIKVQEILFPISTENYSPLYSTVQGTFYLFTCVFISPVATMTALKQTNPVEFLVVLQQLAGWREDAAFHLQAGASLSACEERCRESGEQLWTQFTVQVGGLFTEILINFRDCSPASSFYPIPPVRWQASFLSCSQKLVTSVRLIFNEEIQ